MSSAPKAGEKEHVASAKAQKELVGVDVYLDWTRAMVKLASFAATE